NVPKMPEEALKHFHDDSAREIMSVSEKIDNASDYIKGCYYGAIALTARGCNPYKWTSSTVGTDIEPKRYISFYDRLMSKSEKSYCRDNKNKPVGEAFIHDSRKLSAFIGPPSVGIVFTSPP